MDRVILSRLIVHVFPPSLDLIYRDIQDWAVLDAFVSRENVSTISVMLRDQTIITELCSHYNLLHVETFNEFLDEWNVYNLFSTDVITEYRQLHWRRVVDDLVKKTHAFIWYKPVELTINSREITVNNCIYPFKEFDHNCSDRLLAIIHVLQEAAKVDDCDLIDLILTEEYLWESQHVISEMSFYLPFPSIKRYSNTLNDEEVLVDVERRIRDRQPLGVKSLENFYLFCISHNMEDRYFYKCPKDIEMYSPDIDMFEPRSKDIIHAIVKSFNLRALLKYQEREGITVDIFTNQAHCENAAWTKYMYFEGHNITYYHKFSFCIFAANGNTQELAEYYNYLNWDNIWTIYNRVECLYPYKTIREVFILHRSDEKKLLAGTREGPGRGNYEPYIVRYIVDVLGVNFERDDLEDIMANDKSMLSWSKNK